MHYGSGYTMFKRQNEITYVFWKLYHLLNCRDFLYFDHFVGQFYGRFLGRFKDNFETISGQFWEQFFNVFLIIYGQYLTKVSTVHTFDIVVLNCRDALYFDHCTVAWIEPIDANSIFQLIYDICHIFTKGPST